MFICEICNKEIVGTGTGIINIETDGDGWVDVADQVSSFYHDDCLADRLDYGRQVARIVEGRQYA